MSVREVGSYIGYNRVTSTSQDSASGIWSLAAAERRMRAAAWPTTDDPDFANVVLLLHMDGSNGSTTFTDSSSSPKTITAYGNASQSSAQIKFGSGSMALDGSGDYISTNSSGDFDFASSAMVIEGWFYYTGSTTAPHLWNIGPSSQNRFAAFRLPATGAINLFHVNNGSGTLVATSFVMPTNQWFHFAICKSGNTTRAFANGSQAASTTTLVYPSGEASVIIGHQHFSSNANDYFAGYIDDFRVTKGSDRGYTGSTITVPTAAFPDQ